MKKVIAVLSLGLSVLASGCAQQTAQINSNAGTLRFEDSQSFFVYGIGQRKVVNAVEVCGSADKIAKVESQFTGKNILLSIVTFGIYTPRTARVYCK